MEPLGGGQERAGRDERAVHIDHPQQHLRVKTGGVKTGGVKTGGVKTGRMTAGRAILQRLDTLRMAPASKPAIASIPTRQSAPIRTLTLRMADREAAGCETADMIAAQLGPQRMRSG